MLFNNFHCLSVKTLENLSSELLAEIPAFTINRARLLQRYLKTESYNSINLFHERRGIKTTNQEVTDGGDPIQTNRHATISIKGEPIDVKKFSECHHHGECREYS